MPISAPPPSWASIKDKPSYFDVQAGTVAMFAASSAPTGWLKANGAAISRTSYAALFSAIGTTYGAGDGVSTFNVPDLRGEFVRSLDDGRGVDSGRGIGTAQADDFKSHYHTLDNNANGQSAAGGQYTVSTGDNYWYRTDWTLTKSTGGTETRPRNKALLACIKY